VQLHQPRVDHLQALEEPGDLRVAAEDGRFTHQVPKPFIGRGDLAGVDVARRMGNDQVAARALLRSR
jgi:hypothetical protein